ncbi:MAG: zinc metalloprotease HtpX [Candidatus Woesearchaeota archaeon]|nr:zinc metalloprotease HtpX [Candidatus Woesearchaeota archaeon]
MDGRIKTVVLLGFLSALMLGIGRLLGGFQGLTIGLVFALVMNIGSYWFSDKIVLAIYRAKPFTQKDQPELYKIVKEVAEKAQLPMPKLYIIPSPAPNAFATGRNPNHAAVAFTNGILTLLNKDELRGVIAHELSHIKNRDILITTIAATIAAVISYVGMIVRWGAIFGGFGGRDNQRGGSGGILQFLVLAILAPLTATIIQLAISRAREYQADKTGAETLKDGKHLASALDKLHGSVSKHPLTFGNAQTSSLFIVNPFSAHGLIALFSTHPPAAERIKRLKGMKF